MSHTLKLVSLLLLYIFTGCNNDVERSLTLYEQGKSLQDSQCLDSAVVCYRKAIELLQNSNENELLGNIYNQLGDLFLQTDMYEKAYEAYSKAKEYNSKLKDKTNLSKSYRGMGKSYAFRYVPDTALTFFMNAFELSDLIKDTSEILLINNNLSIAYFGLGQYEKALYHNNIALNLSTGSVDLCRGWFAKADILAKYQQYDSAWYYYELGAHSNNIYTKAACYSALSELSQILQLPDSNKYLKLFVVLKDSIERRDQSAQVEAVDHKFLINKTEKSYRYKLILMFVFLLLCVIISIHLIHRHKKRLSSEREKRIEDIQKNENIISQLHEEMLVLQQEVDAVKDYEKNISENARKLELLKEAEKNVVKNIMNMAVSCSDAFSKSDECKQIRAKLQKTTPKLDKKERDYIYRVVMERFDPLIQYLSTSMNMNLDDCFLCCLSLAKFTAKESAALRCVSWNAIRSQKSRIKMKFIETFHTLEIYEFIFK